MMIYIYIYIYIKLIPNFNSGRVKKAQMIQLVNKQMQKFISVKKFHEKEKTKNIRIVYKNQRI